MRVRFVGTRALTWPPQRWSQTDRAAIGRVALEQCGQNATTQNEDARKQQQRHRHGYSGGGQLRGFAGHRHRQSTLISTTPVWC